MHLYTATAIKKNILKHSIYISKKYLRKYAVISIVFNLPVDVDGGCVVGFIIGTPVDYQNAHFNTCLYYIKIK